MDASKRGPAAPHRQPCAATPQHDSYDGPDSCCTQNSFHTHGPQFRAPHAARHTATSHRPATAGGEGRSGSIAADMLDSLRLSCMGAAPPQPLGRPSSTPPAWTASEGRKAGLKRLLSHAALAARILDTGATPITPQIEESASSCLPQQQQQRPRASQQLRAPVPTAVPNAATRCAVGSTQHSAPASGVAIACDDAAPKRLCQGLALFQLEPPSFDQMPLAPSERQPTVSLTPSLMSTGATCPAGEGAGGEEAGEGATSALLPSPCMQLPTFTSEELKLLQDCLRR